MGGCQWSSCYDNLSSRIFFFCLPNPLLQKTNMPHCLPFYSILIQIEAHTSVSPVLFCSLPCSLSLGVNDSFLSVLSEIVPVLLKRLGSVKETGLVTPMPLNLFSSVALRNHLCNDNERCCFKRRSCILVNSWKAISAEQHFHHVILKT